MGLTIKVDNVADVIKGIKQQEANMAKAVNATCGDFKSRAPGWISKAVTQQYTIKSGEVKGALKGSRNIGTISLSGTTLDNVVLEYSGRVLSFSHFRYTPKKPPAMQKRKTLIPGIATSANRPVVYAQQHRKTNIKVEVLKGKKSALTGRYDTSPFIASMRGSPSMPFQRKTKDRSSAVSLRSVSPPSLNVS